MTIERCAMTPDDEARRRLAIHESAHGLAMWLFGWPIAAISLRPGASHLAITLGVPGTNQHLIDRLDGRHPLDGLDPEARQYADRALVHALIGEAAVEALAPQVGRLPNRADYVAAATAAPAVELNPEAQDRLDAAEADPSGMTDEARAFEMAFRLVGLTAGAYVAWARLEAGRIARDHAAGIYALAGDLVAREAIDGHQVVAIFDRLERSTNAAVQ